MTALLVRRDDRCLSDLTMDRFLLGETPDSDEGRLLERHLAWCSHCLARVQSLRALYAHADMPDVTEAPPPVPSAPTPPLKPEAAGVMELILLRDGLLVGTEVFTQGSWLVGSGPGAQLKLRGPAVASEHARLYFRDGTVVVQRLGGPVLVNGYHVERSEVRPVDELVVGAFVLRARVITHRWEDAEELAPRAPAAPPPARSPAQLATVPARRSLPAAHDAVTALNPVPELPRAATETELPRAAAVGAAAPGLAALARSDELVAEADLEPSRRVAARSRAAAPRASLVRPLALRLDLFWGDALQSSTLVEGAAAERAFPAFSPGRAPSATPVSGGYRLCVPGARLELREGETWRSAGEEVLLTAGTLARAVEGALRLEVRLQPAPERVAPASPRAALTGPFVPVLAFLVLALLTFGLFASTLTEEDVLVERTLPRLTVHLQPPPPKVKPEPQPKDQDTAPKAAETPKPSPRRPASAPAAGPRKPPPHLAGLTGLDKMLDAMKHVTKSPAPSLPGKGKGRADLFAGLGKPGGGAGFEGLGLGAEDAIGIGRAGLRKGGALRVGRIGKGAVGGQLVAPIKRDGLGGDVASIDKDAVARVINEHLHEVSRCYESALLSTPDLSGKLAFEWVVSPTGRVANVKLKSGTMAGTTVAACIAGRIKLWSFPRPRGGAVTISYPFFFRASGF